MFRPGKGWKILFGPVWEHSNGTRVHVSGLIRLPDMSFVHLNRFPEGREGWKYIKICGGNQKRGLMVWAMKLTENY